MLEEKARVLIIDDDLPILDSIRMGLKNCHNLLVDVCEDPSEALSLLKNNEYQTVISDVAMPVISGLDILKAVSQGNPELPVILITGYADTDMMREAIHYGVYEFLKKPFEMDELLMTLNKALETYRLRIQNKAYKDHLESLVTQRTIELFDANNKLQKSYLNTIHAMINAMEVNDIYTRGHSERVTAMSMRMGKLLGLETKELILLRIGALLHDLGKIGIVSNVLSKEHRLTENEYNAIKQHPLIGARIIDPIGFPETVGKIILQHHEWANGEGYPYGIKLNDIHPLARIVSVADSVDAMTSRRPYSRNLDFQGATEEVLNNINRQFDPIVGRIFFANNQQIHNFTKDTNAIKEMLQEAF
ncbi:MAG: response regulator [Candidatus Cloacimonetes bacterium]|jgi:putative nucleotidyltransferase with HDIG domain|nr:response regulator [Candidatus Cloacimonadota bacterium]MDD2507394.1 response regulator [Candidatus Cloacimonadota bacterium]MDD4148292.1 response regulator [Candidatus Cloacimonadota bacterium]MDD4559638.1 response regulator [Candidatus Cloacimonadota bacterium]